MKKLLLLCLLLFTILHVAQELNADVTVNYEQLNTPQRIS